MKELTQHLNWEVEAQQLILPDTRKTRSFALTRTDNGRILSIRSDRYYPVYNRDLEMIRERLVNVSGFQFKGYQEFKQGKRILAFFENPSDNLTICGQHVKDYLIIGNSHDTTSKLFVGTSNYMFRCQNQFSEKIRTFERRHDKPFEIDQINIEQVCGNYELGRRELYRKMERLERMRANRETIRLLVQRLMGELQFNDRLEVPCYRSTEQTLQLYDCIHREILDLGPNLWAVFNGVTRYTSNHMKGNPGFGVVNGNGERMNREALAFLQNMG